MTTRIFINGFGRIGRTVLRQVLSNIDTEQFEIVGINDVADPDTLTYLFKYDSIFGVWRDPVFFMQDRLVIDATSIPFTRKPSLTDLDLHGVDVLLECSGKVSSRSVAESSMTAGAHAVLISGPCEFADQTVVMDANNADLGDARIVSNASCTTNAIAPLLKMLDIGMGVEHAHVTTVHCYTGGQPTVDQVG
ncbi:MAG: glyceraldehyde 3-phosphate dehydrogenase NAD-binding domain-containing protein, partial [Planktomarina sp.]